MGTTLMAMIMKTSFAFDGSVAGLQVVSDKQISRCDRKLFFCLFQVSSTFQGKPNTTEPHKTRTLFYHLSHVARITKILVRSLLKIDTPNTRRQEATVSMMATDLFTTSW